MVGFAVLLSGTIFYQELWRFPGNPEFWGYTEEEGDLDDILRGDTEDGLATPPGGGEKNGLLKKSFTTIDEAKRGSMLSTGSKKTGDRGSQIGSFTNSFIGR